MTDFPDWQAPQAHANAIADTGVPLLTFGNVQQNLSFPLAAGASHGFPQVSMVQPGYEVIVQATANPASTSPFVEVQLQWAINPAAVGTNTDTFVCAGGTTPAGGWFTVGTGPSKGNALTVQIKNLDTVNAMTVAVTVINNSRVYVRDDWRWNAPTDIGGTIPNFTLPTITPDESVLGIGNDTIAGSGSLARIVGSYSGRIKVGLNPVAGTLANVTFNLQALPSTYYQGNNPIIGGAPPGLVFEVAGPRAPMLLRIINTATTAVTFAWSLIAVP